MGKIIFSMQLSLDGYIEGPNGEFDWPIVEAELLDYFNDEIADVDTFLYGRKVYDGMAAFWPTADTNPVSNAPMQEYARIWRPMPKIVFSRTLERADWSTRIVADDLPGAVAELRAQPDTTHLLYGGADVTATFMAHDLIDEYWLFIHPVFLGGGTRLFGPLEHRQDLTLTETRTFSSAVVHARYRRDGNRT